MLIYNYKKEFLGIDEVDLKILGLSDLADLRAEAADFADLFVKTPGFIHNFKHVHWIDYITCNDVGVESKAIISIKGKTYSTILDITSVYLVDNPSQKAFMVNLIKVKALSASQYEKIASDVLEKPAPQTASGPSELFTTPGSIDHSKEDAHLQEDIGEIAYDPYATSDTDVNPNVIDDVYKNTSIINDTKISPDTPIEIDLEDNITEEFSKEPRYQEEIIQTKEIFEEKKKKIEYKKIEGNAAFAYYIYNPYLASDELGLPIDLVEEFIQDFISQADSFKDDLYEYIETNNISNLKIQSHKLKGVAANLRVEDALDALTIINSSDNIDEITINLNRFYKIIAKLSNKNNRVANTTSDIDDTNNKEDNFILSLKDDTTTYEETPEITIDEIQGDENIEIDTNEVEEIIKNDIIETSQNQDYDKESISNDMGLDITSFNESFNEYISESKELANSMVDAYKNDDLDKCKNIATQIKSMNDNMRINKFDDELHTIINSTDINELAELLDSIISKLNQFSNSEG